VLVTLGSEDDMAIVTAKRKLRSDEKPQVGYD
jgi:hypothetical protein